MLKEKDFLLEEDAEVEVKEETKLTKEEILKREKKLFIRRLRNTRIVML